MTRHYAALRDRQPLANANHPATRAERRAGAAFASHGSGFSARARRCDGDARAQRFSPGRRRSRSPPPRGAQQPLQQLEAVFPTGQGLATPRSIFSRFVDAQPPRTPRATSRLARMRPRARFGQPGPDRSIPGLNRQDLRTSVTRRSMRDDANRRPRPGIANVKGTGTSERPARQRDTAIADL